VNVWLKTLLKEKDSRDRGRGKSSNEEGKEIFSKKGGKGIKFRDNWGKPRAAMSPSCKVRLMFITGRPCNPEECMKEKKKKGGKELKRSNVRRRAGTVDENKKGNGKNKAALPGVWGERRGADENSCLDNARKGKKDRGKKRKGKERGNHAERLTRNAIGELRKTRGIRKRRKGVIEGEDGKNRQMVCLTKYETYQAKRQNAHEVELEGGPNSVFRGKEGGKKGDKPTLGESAGWESRAKKWVC